MNIENLTRLASQLDKHPTSLFDHPLWLGSEHPPIDGIHHNKKAFDAGELGEMMLVNVETVEGVEEPITKECLHLNEVQIVDLFHPWFRPHNKYFILVGVTKNGDFKRMATTKEAAIVIRNFITTYRIDWSCACVN